MSDKYTTCSALSFLSKVTEPVNAGTLTRKDYVEIEESIKFLDREIARLKAELAGYENDRCIKNVLDPRKTWGPVPVRDRSVESIFSTPKDASQVVDDSRKLGSNYWDKVTIDESTVGNGGDPVK